MHEWSEVQQHYVQGYVNVKTHWEQGIDSPLCLPHLRRSSGECAKVFHGASHVQDMVQPIDTMV